MHCLWQIMQFILTTIFMQVDINFISIVHLCAMLLFSPFPFLWHKCHPAYLGRQVFISLVFCNDMYTFTYCLWHDAEVPDENILKSSAGVWISPFENIWARPYKKSFREEAVQDVTKGSSEYCRFPAVTTQMFYFSVLHKR